MDWYSKTTNEFARVLEEGLIVGPQTTLKSYNSPKEALDTLIQWHVDVALGPKVSAHAAALVEQAPTDYVLVPQNIHPLSDTARPKVIALLKEAPDARGFDDENDYYEDWWWQLTEAASERNN